MGEVIDDFRQSSAPQFKEKSDKKIRQMAIAAKLNTESADTGVEPSPQELMLQKRASMTRQQIERARTKSINKARQDAIVAQKEEVKFSGNYPDLDEGIRSGLAAAGLAAAVATHGGGKKAETHKSPAPEKSQAVQVSKKKETKSPEQIWREKHPNLAAKEDSKEKPASVKSQLSDVRDMIARSKARQQNNSFEPQGELVDEATRAAKKGKKDEHRVGVEIRAKQAATSLAAKKSRQAVLDKHEKKTGTKLDIMKTPEGESHAKNFPGSRQEPNERGAKETPAETQRRRTNSQVSRVLKHGYTSKEKKNNAAMAKHTSRHD